MRHDIKLDTCPFHGPLLFKKKYTSEQIPRTNHKYGSRPKYFNKDNDTVSCGPPKFTIQCHQPKYSSMIHMNPSIPIKIKMTPLPSTMQLINIYLMKQK